MNDLFAFLADLSDPLPENAEDTNLAATWKKQVELKLQAINDLHDLQSLSDDDKAELLYALFYGGIETIHKSALPWWEQADFGELNSLYLELQNDYHDKYGHYYPL